MARQDLVLMKEQIARLDKRNLATAEQTNALALTNVLDFTVDGGGVDFIRNLAQQS